MMLNDLYEELIVAFHDLHNSLVSEEKAFLANILWLHFIIKAIKL